MVVVRLTKKPRGARLAPAAAPRPGGKAVNELRLHGADRCDAILTMGVVENSVIVFGYNTLPNYVLDDVTDDGLAWCIEPCYTDPNGRECKEAYLQFQRRGTRQEHIRRPFMAKIRCDTGEVEAVELSAGPGGQGALCAHDGAVQNATGEQILTWRADGVRVAHRLELDGAPVLAALDLDASGALIVRAGTARFRIACEALPPA